MYFFVNNKFYTNSKLIMNKYKLFLFQQEYFAKNVFLKSKQKIVSLQNVMENVLLVDQSDVSPPWPL